MREPSYWRTFLTSFVILAATTLAAQTFTTLASFDGTDGSDPEYATLVQGRDGNFYGTHFMGCSDGNACMAYKITRAGTLTTFCDNTSCAGLLQAYGGLVLATNGNFYGTNAQGGANTWGTVYKMTPTGVTSFLYSFCALPNCADGLFPLFGVIQASNGNLYGTTPSAGVVGSQGTIFQLTLGGKLTTLHTFNGSDGSSPSGPLLQASDGNFYGEALSGGAFGQGTIFAITAQGKFRTLHSFNGADGANPSLGLIQATDGNFYGTTQRGGANGSCSFGCGTVFKMTPAGTLTTLYNFCMQADCTDGSVPIAPLAQGTDGNFYGTAGGGGSTAWGVVFQLTPSGTLTPLHTFAGPPDGSTPQSGLLQATNGTFYGATTWGGSGCTGVGCGSVYSLSMGLGTFVSFVNRAAKVGQTAQILGQGLKGTTNVSFNGIAAAITSKTDTFLAVTVPAGATTGYVTVTTPTGTLTSNVPFRVIP